MSGNFFWVDGICLNLNNILFFSIYSFGGYAVRAHFSLSADDYKDIAIFSNSKEAKDYINSITSNK